MGTLLVISKKRETSICLFYFSSNYILIIRTNLIDTGIEEALSRMQTVIELGRYIRDRKIVPTKVSIIIIVLHVLDVFSTII